jgi:hypothetical protein
MNSLRLLSASRHAVNNDSLTSAFTFLSTPRFDKEPNRDLSMREWMLTNEPSYLPDPNYMGHKQHHLTPKMRFILLSWLTEVSEENDSIQLQCFLSHVDFHINSKFK